MAGSYYLCVKKEASITGGKPEGYCKDSNCKSLTVLAALKDEASRPGCNKRAQDLGNRLVLDHHVRKHSQARYCASTAALCCVGQALVHSKLVASISL